MGPERCYTTDPRLSLSDDNELLDLACMRDHPRYRKTIILTIALGRRSEMNLNYELTIMDRRVRDIVRLFCRVKCPFRSRIS